MKEHDLYPFDIPIAMRWNQLVSIMQVISEYRVNLFVEIGLNKGGIGSVVMHRARYVPDFWYLGVETNYSNVDHRFKEVAATISTVTLFDGDCFSKEFLSRLVSHRDFTRVPMFILCDGGNKPKEFSFFKSYLRAGDFIAPHDYLVEVSPEFLKENATPEEFEEINPVEYREMAKFPIFRKR